MPTYIRTYVPIYSIAINLPPSRRDFNNLYTYIISSEICSKALALVCGILVFLLALSLKPMVVQGFSLLTFL